MATTTATTATTMPTTVTTVTTVTETNDGDDDRIFGDSFQFLSHSSSPVPEGVEGDAAVTCPGQSETEREGKAVVADDKVGDQQDKGDDENQGNEEFSEEAMAQAQQYLLEREQRRKRREKRREAKARAKARSLTEADTLRGDGDDAEGGEEKEMRKEKNWEKEKEKAGGDGEKEADEDGAATRDTESPRSTGSSSHRRRRSPAVIVEPPSMDEIIRHLPFGGEPENFAACRVVVCVEGMFKQCANPRQNSDPRIYYCRRCYVENRWVEGANEAEAGEAGEEEEEASSKPLLFRFGLYPDLIEQWNETAVFTPKVMLQYRTRSGIFDIPMFYKYVQKNRLQRFMIKEAVETYRRQRTKYVFNETVQIPPKSTLKNNPLGTEERPLPSPAELLQQMQKRRQEQQRRQRGMHAAVSGGDTDSQQTRKYIVRPSRSRNKDRHRRNQEEEATLLEVIRSVQPTAVAKPKGKKRARDADSDDGDMFTNAHKVCKRLVPRFPMRSRQSEEDKDKEEEQMLLARIREEGRICQMFEKEEEEEKARRENEGSSLDDGGLVEDWENDASFEKMKNDDEEIDFSIFGEEEAEGDDNADGCDE